MKRLIGFIVLILMFSTSVAFAQQEAGDIELVGSVQYYTLMGTDTDFSSGSIRVKLGLFMTDRLEVGGFPRIQISSFEGDVETTIGIGGFAMYSFLSDSTMVPYFGGQLEVNDIDEMSDTMSAGIGGGAKIYVSEKTFIDLNGNYGFPLWEDAEGGVLTLYAGLGYLFRLGD